MGRIPDSVLLEMWERGSCEHPLDRALTLIAIAEGGGTRSELAALPIVERDQRLLGMAAALFGARITLIAECPDCETETEMSFTMSDIEGLSAPESGATPTFHHDGREITYRPPDSRDLAHALSLPDPEAARRTFLTALLDRPEAPETLLESFDAALAERAGLEALTLAHICSGCGADREAPFDILDYLWRHVVARAKHTLWDIHRLAHAYGWTSTEILLLSPERRAAHIAMVTA